MLCCAVQLAVGDHGDESLGRFNQGCPVVCWNLDLTRRTDKHEMKNRLYTVRAYYFV